MSLPPIRISYLPECNRQASHIKRGYEIYRKIENNNGKSVEEWVEVSRKQHDSVNGVVLFTFIDGTQLRAKADKRILSRRGEAPMEKGDVNNGKS